MELTPSQRTAVSLRLSLQRALLGEIGPGLRAVTCSSSDDGIVIRAIFDGEAGPEDRESMSEVATEVAADFAENVLVDDEIIRVDMPNSYKDKLLDHLVYARRED